MNKKLTIAQRGITAVASPIRKLLPFAQAAEKQGRKIYHLNIGDPDFVLPDVIQQTLQRIAATTKKLPYPAFRGQQDLITAWLQYYKQIQVPLPLTSEDVLITSGASDAMVLIAATVLDPGDEMIVFEPFFAPYQIYAQFISATLVPVALTPINGYHLPTREEIVAKITPQTKAIFFTNPNNPTGTVFTKSEMHMLLDIAYEYKLFLVNDETYRGMVFEGSESFSMLHIAEEKHLDNIIIADSLSKRLNVCGARMGIVVSKNREFMDAAFRFIQGRPYAAFLEQEIVTPMLTDSLPYVAWLSKEYQKRRDAFIITLEKELNITISKPEGAFYAMVQLPITDTDAFAKWLLTDFSIENETVMVSPGAGFYATPGKGTNEVRIAYVLNEKDLQHAAILLAKGVKEYKKTHEAYA